MFLWVDPHEPAKDLSAGEFPDSQAAIAPLTREVAVRGTAPVCPAPFALGVDCLRDGGVARLKPAGQEATADRTG